MLFSASKTLLFASLLGGVLGAPQLEAAGKKPKPPPTKFAVAVFPGYTSIDIFGPMAFLELLSFRTKLDLYILAPTMDPVSTKPGMNNTFGSTFYESILPTHTFDNPPKDVEVLLVPGGLGTRGPASDPVVPYIKKAYPKLKYLLTVCTGATLAAKAGVLDGKKATTNKLSWVWATSTGPKTYWKSHARWVVDGNIWTSSGVTAGMDMGIAWVSAVWGADMAHNITVGTEWILHPDAGNDPYGTLYNLTDVNPKGKF